MRRSIRGWQVVSRDMIMVEGIGTEQYLVRYSGACIANPRFEIAVGFESRDFQTCPYGLDALMIDGQRCTIWDIWDLPPEGANTQQPAS